MMIWSWYNVDKSQLTVLQTSHNLQYYRQSNKKSHNDNIVVSSHLPNQLIVYEVEPVKEEKIGLKLKMQNNYHT